MSQRKKIAVRVVLGVVAVWLLGDLLYSCVVAYKVSQWEQTIERDEEGVWEGCQAYTTASSIAGKGVDSDKGALLLVHGINASPKHYDKMAAQLAELGYTCRVMRLPGFAEPIPKYAASKHGHWIGAVRQELTDLRSEHERVGIVAHSLGGAVAIGQLLKHPESADFAVLLAPATAVSSHRSPVFSTRSWHRFGNATLLFTSIMQSPFGIDCHDPDQRDYPGRSPFTPRSVVDELYTLIDDNWEQIDQFQTPLLMVLSKDDIVIDWQAAERYYDLVPVKQKQLMFLKDSGHAIPIDYGWQETVDAIDQFANEVGT